MHIFLLNFKAPTDVRCRLAANILVVGGVGHLPGLEKRLGQEILESVASNPAFLDLKSIILKKYINLLICVRTCIFDSIFENTISFQLAHVGWCMHFRRFEAIQSQTGFH